MARKRQTKKPDDQTSMFLLRMPVAIREQIESSAKTEGRSINAQIVHSLKTALNGVGAPPQADLVNKVNEMESLVFKIAYSLNNLYAQSIQDVEKIDPSTFDYYPDELDPKEIEEKLRSLKENIIPVARKTPTKTKRRNK